MNEIEWKSGSEFSVGGVDFLCSIDDFSRKSTADRIVILKARSVIDEYATVLAGAAPKNALEFGIFEGGSPILFTLWFDLAKFVGLDICEPVAGLEEFRRRHPLGGRISAHYEIDQSDRPRVEKIIADEFGGAPLDLIIDDASHRYDSTRRSFEIAFPHLRPGGFYVVEDWGWAHWPGQQLFMGQSALSILIMELIMLCASRSDLISEVRVFPAFAFIRKAPNAPALADFKLDSAYSKRGLEIVTADQPNLGGVAKLFRQRMQLRFQNKMRSLRKRTKRGAQ